MLFNILSCVMIFFIGILVWMLVAKKDGETEETIRYFAYPAGFTALLIFAWIMSYLNLWR